MEKETIEKFNKEQLEILLNDLQDIDKFTGFKDGAFKYELGKYQASLLVNCIKEQKEIIDKIDNYCHSEIDKCKYEQSADEWECCIEELKGVLKILKEEVK